MSKYQLLDESSECSCGFSGWTPKLDAIYQKVMAALAATSVLEALPSAGLGYSEECLSFNS